MSSITKKGVDMPDGKVCPEQFRGWLLKWTNYIKGYQKRWFVLSKNGLLSYYRTQEEMVHTCRGTVNLAGAFIDTIDATNFVITNGPSQVYYVRALNEVERQRWVTALELAKAKAIKNLESDESDGGSGEEEVAGGGRGNSNPVTAMQEKLKELSAAHDLVIKNNALLVKQIIEVEGGTVSGASLAKLKEKLALFKLTSDAMAKSSDEFLAHARHMDRRWERMLHQQQAQNQELQKNMVALASQMKGLEEEAIKKLRIKEPYSMLPPPIQAPRTLSTSSSTAEAMVPTGGSELGVGSGAGVKVASKERGEEGEGEREEEREKGSVGEGGTTPDVSGVGAVKPNTDVNYGDLDDEDDDKFFDAQEGSFDQISLEANSPVGSEADTISLGARATRTLSSDSVYEPPPPHHTGEAGAADILPLSSDKRMSIPSGPAASFLSGEIVPTLAKRRQTIPPKPNVKLNLWNLLKNCIGKDLSKIPFPVNINEPVSMLQRMMEHVYYADLLTQASQALTTLEELPYLAAFVLSAYPHTIYRMAKPFNPLLGETFECDRRAEAGWRSFMEQVSHHPPMFAHFVEHRDWIFWQEWTMTISFRGKYVACYPVGCCHLVFHRSKSHYTWGRPTVIIHNIIVGQPWVDQAGEVKVINHTTREECKMKFHSYSYFSRERQRRVTGIITDSEGAERYAVKGYWDEDISVAKVIKGRGKNREVDKYEQLWKADPPEPGCEKMYSFSEFTCSLNELEEGVAPTDCRFRPDQRFMEQQDFDKANEEKYRLEEKQRAKRKKREAAASKAAKAAVSGNHEEAQRLEREATYSPVWFKKEYDPLTNSMMHVYQGGYWEAKQKGNWDELNLPDLY